MPDATARRWGDGENSLVSAHLWHLFRVQPRPADGSHAQTLWSSRRWSTAAAGLALLASACSTTAASAERTPAPTTTSTTAVLIAPVVPALAQLAAGPDLAAIDDATRPVGRLAGRRICIDPGHDAFYSRGSTGRNTAGVVPIHPTERIRLYEVDLALAVSYRLKAILDAEGAATCVTRREDGTFQIPPYDFTGDGRVRSEGQATEDAAERLQTRIDWANQFGAELFVSVHFNGAGDSAMRGTEVYYTDVGPTAAQGKALAEALMKGVLDEMRARGYPGVNRGVQSDRFRRLTDAQRAVSLRHNSAAIIANGADPAKCPDCQRLLVLGNNPASLHMGTYLGALVELEYLSSFTAIESLLLRPDSIELLATGLANGLLAYADAG